MYRWRLELSLEDFSGELQDETAVEEWVRMAIHPLGVAYMRQLEIIDCWLMEAYESDDEEEDAESEEY